MPFRDSFDCLWCGRAWTTRTGSDLEGWAGLLNACRRTGTLVHITRDGRTYDPAVGRDWRSLAEDGVSAAYFSEELSMAIRSGKASGLRAGRPQGSIAFGIRRVRDPERTRHAFAGEGYQNIADALTAEHVPSKRGGRWHAETVRRIAANPVYAAVGLVTEEESARARARLADTARKGERAGRQTFRYSGVLACSGCREPVRGAARRGGDFSPGHGAVRSGRGWRGRFGPARHTPV